MYYLYKKGAPRVCLFINKLTPKCKKEVLEKLEKEDKLLYDLVIACDTKKKGMKNLYYIFPFIIIFVLKIQKKSNIGMFLFQI